MSSAFKAQGTQLAYYQYVTTTTVDQTVAEVLSLSGPTTSRDFIDVTNMDSTGGFREVILGLGDGGEVTFDINFLPTDSSHDGSTGLVKLLDDAERRKWDLAFPDNSTTPTTWTFWGYVNGFEPSAGIDEQMKASVTIKVDGKPTFA